MRLELFIIIVIDKITNFKITPSNSAPSIPLIVHIPHSSVFIPPAELPTFKLSDKELKAELLRMTDGFTDELFTKAEDLGGLMFINNVSRLVCDPERFPDDESEPMVKMGMGAVYTSMSDGQPLRVDSFNSADKDRIMNQYFYAYAKALEDEVTKMLEVFGKCFIVDGHSFPSTPLPYEDPSSNRPDICIGYDDFHSPCELINKIETICDASSFSYRHNEPFSGSYVPMKYFQKELNIKSLMIEVRRGSYMDELSGAKSQEYEKTKNLVSEILGQVASSLNDHSKVW